MNDVEESLLDATPLIMLVLGNRDLNQAIDSFGHGEIGVVLKVSEILYLLLPAGLRFEILGDHIIAPRFPRQTQSICLG